MHVYCKIDTDTNKNKRIFANEKILRIKLNKIRKLKGVKNALYLFNNSHKY
jgi:hypothetical protein